MTSETRRDPYAALFDLFGACLNEMAAHDLPLEFVPNCPMGRAALVLFGTTDSSKAVEQYRATLRAAEGDER